MPDAIDALIRFLVPGLIAYAVLTLLAFLLVENALFQPPPPSYAAEPPITRIRLGADTLAMFHLATPDARYVILHSHGNAEDLGHVRPFLEMIRAAGFGVLAYDYRGYGRSTGRPTIRGAIEDIEAAYDFAVGGLGIAPDRLILQGQSLGSGPTLELAARRPVAGVVLVSAFTSPYRVVTRVPLLPFDRFPNLARVRKLDCPLLVVHGTDDRVIPVWHGRRLFAAAPEPKRAVWVAGAGHNDLVYSARDRYGEALRELVALIEGTGPQQR